MHYFFDYLSEIKEDCNTLYYCATRAYELVKVVENLLHTLHISTKYLACSKSKYYTFNELICYINGVI